MTDLAPTKENIQNAIITYLSRSAGVVNTELNPSTQLKDTGLNSILAVQMASHLEKTFNIGISTTQLRGDTIGQLAAALVPQG